MADSPSDTDALRVSIAHGDGQALAPVPEPGSLLLGIMGGVIVFGFSRRVQLDERKVDK